MQRYELISSHFIISLCHSVWVLFKMQFNVVSFGQNVCHIIHFIENRTSGNDSVTWAVQMKTRKIVTASNIFLLFSLYASALSYKRPKMLFIKYLHGIKWSSWNVPKLKTYLGILGFFIQMILISPQNSRNVLKQSMLFRSLLKNSNIFWKNIWLVETLLFYIFPYFVTMIPLKNKLSYSLGRNQNRNMYMTDLWVDVCDLD